MRLSRVMKAKDLTELRSATRETQRALSERLAISHGTISRIERAGYAYIQVTERVYRAVVAARLAAGLDGAVGLEAPDPSPDPAATQASSG